MGGAQAIFALASAPRRSPRSTSSPVPATPGCGRRSARSRAGRHRLARRALGADGGRRATTATPSGRRSTSAPRPSTAPTARWSPPRSRSRCSTRSQSGQRGAARRGRASPTRPWRWSRCPTSDAAIDLANAFAPEHLELLEEDAALLADRGDHRRLRLRRALRGAPPSATTSPAPTTCCRPAAPGASRGRSGPAPSAAGSPPSRFPAEAAAELAPHVDALARAEGFPVHGESAMIRAMSASGRAESADAAETQIQLSLDLDGGEASAATGRRLPRPHARPARPPRPARPEGRGRAATSRPAPTTRSRTSASCSGRRSTRRSATAPASAATAPPWCRWTSRWPSARSTSRGRPLCAFDADLPATSIAGFDTELAEEFFRAVANSAKLTLHVSVRYGTNAHHMIEACFKAFARALRVAVSIDPEETGVPSTKGTLSE